MISLKNRNTEEIEERKLFSIIGSNVKYYRNLYSLEKTKITQEKLAELVDVSTSLIGNLESSSIDQGVSVFVLWKISQVLEVPIDKLFEDREKKNTQN